MAMDEEFLNHLADATAALAARDNAQTPDDWSAASARAQEALDAAEAQQKQRRR